MHSLFLTLPFVAAASALSVPRSTCSFQLTASGAQNGTVGRLDDGQVRLGGGLPQTTFSISGNGSVTDVAGFGCVLTSVGQFQCDEYASSTGGFAIASNGSFTAEGSSVFYACAASDSEYNLYTTPVAGQAKCYEVELSASGCAAASAVASSTCAPVTITETSTQAASSVVETVTITSVQTASQAAQTITESQTVTYSAPAITESQTVTYSAPAITAEASTITETQTVQVTDDITLSASTVYSTLYQTMTESQAPSTVTETQAPSTVTETQAPSTVTETQAPSTVTETQAPSTVTETQVATTTSVEEASTSVVEVAPTPSAIAATTTVAKPTSAASVASSASTCAATTLSGSYTSGNYQYPHLIVPISSSTPTTAAGTQYFGTISSNTSTIFNFDIPSSYSGSTCNLIFLLPEHADLETSSYTETGSGQIDFLQLSSAATSATTYSNAPSVSSDLGTFTITEGSSTLIKSFACPAGETVTYELSSVADTYLYFFQDYNPSPLGLYVTVC